MKEWKFWLFICVVGLSIGLSNGFAIVVGASIIAAAYLWPDDIRKFMEK